MGSGGRATHIKLGPILVSLRPTRGMALSIHYMGDWMHSKVGLDVGLFPTGNRTTIPPPHNPYPGHYTY